MKQCTPIRKADGVHFRVVNVAIGFVTPNSKATGLIEAYQKSCDFAFMKVTTGAQDYISAVQEATKALAEKGIQVFVIQ